MPDYTIFKKTFCDCCDTKKKGLCCIGLRDSRMIRDNSGFIDWEELLEERDAEVHDKKHCDCVYVNPEKNITFFIEQKQYLFVYENPLAEAHEKKLKNPAKFAQSLLNKFKNTKDVFIADGNDVNSYEFVFAYNLNEIDGKRTSTENIERLLRINYEAHFEAADIRWMDCKSAAKHVLYD